MTPPVAAAYGRTVATHRSAGALMTLPTPKHRSKHASTLASFLPRLSSGRDTSLPRQADLVPAEACRTRISGAVRLGPAWNSASVSTSRE